MRGKKAKALSRLATAMFISGGKKPLPRPRHIHPHQAYHQGPRRLYKTLKRVYR